jgi:hypothetical protein
VPVLVQGQALVLVLVQVLVLAQALVLVLVQVEPAEPFLHLAALPLQSLLA